MEANLKQIFSMQNVPGFRLGTKSIVSFNHADIQKYITGIEKKILQKAGASTMNRARKLIQPAPAGKASAPGSPFHSHPVNGKQRHAANSGIKRSIQYAMELNTRTVVIGPTFAQDIFRRHEYGGKEPVRRRKLQIGDAGLIAIGRTYKNTRGKGRKNKGRHLYVRDNSGAQQEMPVVFTKLNSAMQVERAQELEEIIYGEYKSQADYPARPVLQATIQGQDYLEKELRVLYMGG